MDERYYSVREIAEKWRVDAQSVLRLIRSGKLKAFRIGREYRVSESAVRSYENWSPPVEVTEPQRRKRESVVCAQRIY